MTTRTERPEALGDQLRWVHDMLRRDLAAVRELAGRVVEGASTREVRDGLAELEAGGHCSSCARTAWATARSCTRTTEVRTTCCFLRYVARHRISRPS